MQVLRSNNSRRAACRHSGVFFKWAFLYFCFPLFPLSLSVILIVHIFICSRSPPLSPVRMSTLYLLFAPKPASFVALNCLLNTRQRVILHGADLTALLVPTAATLSHCIAGKNKERKKEYKNTVLEEKKCKSKFRSSISIIDQQIGSIYFCDTFFHIPFQLLSNFLSQSLKISSILSNRFDFI